MSKRPARLGSDSWSPQKGSGKFCLPNPKKNMVYGNPMPESTLSPSQGLGINPQDMKGTLKRERNGYVVLNEIALDSWKIGRWWL